MTVIEFTGWRHEVDAAEKWCGPNVYEGYAIQRVARGVYHFTFFCAFEAQRFRDVHGKNTKRLY